MFRRVVVPLDGSPLAEAILPAVQRLAADSPLEVVLLAVGRMPQAVEQRGATVVQIDEVVNEQESDLRESLNKPAGVLRSAQIRVQTRVRFGDPATEIVRCAEEETADAIAMSTHGRTGIDRVLHGSVAGTVLRSTHMPLLLVRPAAEAFAALPMGGTADR